MSTDLELLANPGTTLADVARAVALGDVLEKVVKARRAELRDGPLADLAAQAAEVTGSDGFTSRINGVGQVIQTAPTPTVKVQDSQRFGEWLALRYVNELVEIRTRVEVTDHDTAAACIEALNDGDLDGVGLIDEADRLAGCLKVVAEWFPSEAAVDTLLDDGRIVVHEGRVHTLDAGAVGDPVPGLTVTQARQSTYVKVDKDARERVTGEVRKALGLGDDT